MPWAHIVQHLYQNFADLGEFKEFKGKHTFWPDGTTEKDVLKAMVDILNTGKTNRLANAYLVYDEKNYKYVTTFYPDKPTAPEDQYDSFELSELLDLLPSQHRG